MKNWKVNILLQGYNFSKSITWRVVIQNDRVTVESLISLRNYHIMHLNSSKFINVIKTV